MNAHAAPFRPRDLSNPASIILLNDLIPHRELTVDAAFGPGMLKTCLDDSIGFRSTADCNDTNGPEDKTGLDHSTGSEDKTGLLDSTGFWNSAVGNTIPHGTADSKSESELSLSLNRLGTLVDELLSEISMASAVASIAPELDCMCLTTATTAATHDATASAAADAGTCSASQPFAARLPVGSCDDPAPGGHQALGREQATSGQQQAAAEHVEQRWDEPLKILDKAVVARESVVQRVRQFVSDFDLALDIETAMLHMSERSLSRLMEDEQDLRSRTQKLEPAMRKPKLLWLLDVYDRQWG